MARNLLKTFVRMKYFFVCEVSGEKHVVRWDMSCFGSNQFRGGSTAVKFVKILLINRKQYSDETDQIFFSLGNCLQFLRDWSLLKWKWSHTSFLSGGVRNYWAEGKQKNWPKLWRKISKNFCQIHRTLSMLGVLLSSWHDIGYCPHFSIFFLLRNYLHKKSFCLLFVLL